MHRTLIDFNFKINFSGLSVTDISGNEEYDVALRESLAERDAAIAELKKIRLKDSENVSGISCNAGEIAQS